MSTGNGRTQIAVLKDVSVGCMAPDPHCLSFLLFVGFSGTVHFRMCIHPLAVQLGSAACQALSEACREAGGDHAVCTSRWGLWEVWVTEVWAVFHTATLRHPKRVPTWRMWKMTGRFLGLPWFPANPTTWGHCRVLGGTFSPSCRGSDDDGEEESAAQGSRQTHDNLYRVHMPSLYSCGSSYGSETSIPAAAHTVSNAPVTEYMWVSPRKLLHMASFSPLLAQVLQGWHFWPAGKKQWRILFSYWHLMGEGNSLKVLH